MRQTYARRDFEGRVGGTYHAITLTLLGVAGLQKWKGKGDGVHGLCLASECPRGSKFSSPSFSFFGVSGGGLHGRDCELRVKRGTVDLAMMGAS